MRRLIALAAVWLPLWAWGAPTNEADFLAAVQGAVAAKDVARLMGLTYLAGGSEIDTAATKMAFTAICQQGEVRSAGLAPLPDSLKTPDVVDGVTYGTTYPPQGVVALVFTAPQGGEQTVSTAYAVIEGAYYLVGTKTTEK